MLSSCGSVTGCKSRTRRLSARRLLCRGCRPPRRTRWSPANIDLRSAGRPILEVHVPSPYGSRVARLLGQHVQAVLVQLEMRQALVSVTPSNAIEQTLEDRILETAKARHPDGLQVSQVGRGSWAARLSNKDHFDASFRVFGLGVGTAAVGPELRRDLKARWSSPGGICSASLHSASSRPTAAAPR